MNLRHHRRITLAKQRGPAFSGHQVSIRHPLLGRVKFVPANVTEFGWLPDRDSGASLSMSVGYLRDGGAGRVANPLSTP